MNLVDCVVREVLGNPEPAYGKWFVRVSYDSYGQISETELIFDNKEDAALVKRGHEFLS